MLRWLPFITLAVRGIALERLVSLLVDGQDWLHLRKVAFMEHIWPLARGRMMMMIFPMRVSSFNFNFANMDGSEVRKDHLLL